MPTYSFEQIYDSVLGEALGADRLPEVENAFAEGSFCAAQYEIMWKAYVRLSNGGENSDLEIIRNALSVIQRELCQRMYDYGTRFGNQ